MYPLRMTRSLAVAAGIVAVAAPASASAAELAVTPEKRCYAHGESVNLIGSGFTPGTNASITRDGALLGSLPTDGLGAFNGLLTLAQPSGQRTKTYSAADGINPALTASDQITVSAVRVGLKPNDGAPGRVMRINARGFTTGKTLWAHVVKGKRKRHIRLGRLKGACGRLKTRRRLLKPDAALGMHTIQFDTFRRYRSGRAVRDVASIEVTRG
jgi:hypothetical protein